MIKVSEPALTYICRSFGIQDKDLDFLGGGRGDSDGITYVYFYKGQKRVLKILAFDLPGTKEIAALNERLKFMNYLGESDIHIAYPEENGNHRLYETYEDEKNIFVSYSMKFYPGKSPSSKELLTDISWHWGKLTGKAHKVTKQYPVWKNLSSNIADYGYQDEVDFFINWCKDETVKKEWKKILPALSHLPINRNTYGFIHNDNHQNNILTDNNSITLIDFDVSSCNFFLQDITVPVQGILFDLSGGMINEVFDKEPLKYFFNQFLNGYETENHINDFWLGQIDTFIQYRRLLLFTCMQDYFEDNLKAKENFLSVIKAGAEVYNLL